MPNNHYDYTGVTVYLKDSNLTQSRLRMLADAIFQLMPFVDHDAKDISGESSYPDSENFALLKKNHEFFTNNASLFPENMPDVFQDAHVTKTVANGHPLVRLHIPVITQDENLTAHIVEDLLVEGFAGLFGDDLISLKTKSGCEWDDFEAIPVKTIISADRFNVPA